MSREDSRGEAISPFKRAIVEGSLANFSLNT